MKSALRSMTRCARLAGCMSSKSGSSAWGHERMKQLLDAVALFNTVFEKEVDNERQN